MQKIDDWRSFQQHLDGDAVGDVAAGLLRVRLELAAS